MGNLLGFILVVSVIIWPKGWLKLLGLFAIGIIIGLIIRSMGY